MTNSQLIRLVLLVFVAVTSIVIGDTAGKLLGQAGVAPIIVAWSRFIFGALFVLPFCGLQLSELAYLRDWRVLARGILIAGGISFILTALKTEPMANVFGAFFISPIVSYILAIVFLRETPSRTRGVLLGIGFIGVLLVVKPGFGVSTGILCALAAGTCHGSYLTMTRTIAGQYRPRFLLISQLFIGALVLTPLGLGVTLPTLDLWVGTMITISALGSAIGNYMLVIASRNAEASLIAPLIYTQLISAAGIGVLVFGDWPDAYAALGLCLILGSGIGSLVASRRR